MAAAVRQVNQRRRRVAQLYAFMSNINGVILADRNGSISEANDAFLRIVGYTREDLLAGKVRWTDMTSPEYYDLDARVTEEVDKSGVCATFEKELVRKDGARVPVLVGAAALEGSSGTGVAFILDLTDRKRAERELRESEQRYRALVENAKDIIYTQDLDGNFTSANAAGELITGYSHEEILKLNIAHVLAPEYREVASLMLERKLTDGLPTTFEVEIIAKDGHRVPLEVNSRPIYKDNASVFGAFGTFQEWVRKQPQWTESHIHDYLFVFVILAFALDIFSLRRLIDLRREIVERKRAEEDRERLIRNYKRRLPRSGS